MGCDIHLYVEVKKDGKWVSADTWETDDGWTDVTKHFYSGRNYDLFAMLANVRNGRGFAGCDTGDGFNPISEPKGLPEDVSPEVKKLSEQWDADGHSHSHLTVQELLDYDWTQTTTKRGIVDAPTFFEWSRWQRSEGLGPDNYCGGVSGGSIREITEEEMKALIDKALVNFLDESVFFKKKVIETSLPHEYCSVSWKTPYYRAAGEFLSETFFRLIRLGKPEDVRIVFFFDN